MNDHLTDSTADRTQKVSGTSAAEGAAGTETEAKDLGFSRQFCGNTEDEPELYNDSEGEPDYTLEDDEEFGESLEKALRYPNP